MTTQFHPPYVTLNTHRAVGNLKRDIDASSLSLPSYVAELQNNYERLPSRNAWMYVAGIPENYERFKGTYDPNRHTRQAFLVGTILAQRAVLTSLAARIVFKVGLKEIEPIVKGEFIERGEYLCAQVAEIKRRANLGLEGVNSLRYDLADWSLDLSSSPKAALHVRDGFGYALDVFETAAAEKVGQELSYLASGRWSTPAEGNA